jgi:hypothetical protein
MENHHGNQSGVGCGGNAAVCVETKVSYSSRFLELHWQCLLSVDTRTTKDHNFHNEGNNICWAQWGKIFVGSSRRFEGPWFLVIKSTNETFACGFKFTVESRVAAKQEYRQRTSNKPGRSNFFFPRAKNSFHFGSTGQETLPCGIFRLIANSRYIWQYVFRKINCHSICSNMHFIQMRTNYYRVTHCFKFSPVTACIWEFLLEKHFWAGWHVCRLYVKQQMRNVLFQIPRGKENKWACTNM